MEGAQVRGVALVLVIALALGSMIGSAAPGSASGSGVDGTSAQVSLVGPESGPETDNTVTRIVVHENGSATWTLQIRTRLETNESEAEYRAFQDRFRENTSQYLGAFQESIIGIVESASDVTGREMTASGFRASTTIQFVPRRWGIVTFTFRWDGFAMRNGEELVVGDVFQGGLFIADGDSLEIIAPDGYRVESTDPTPDELGDQMAAWIGREDFADQRPRVVLAPTRDGLWPPSWSVLIGGAALVVVVLAGWLGTRWWRDGRPRPRFMDDSGRSGPGSALEEGVMADEDYVLQALSEHGGRMRQTDIANELDWSRSKTSRVLGRMEDNESIRKLQLGRENVIALPDEEDE